MSKEGKRQRHKKRDGGEIERERIKGATFHK